MAQSSNGVWSRQPECTKTTVTGTLCDKGADPESDRQLCATGNAPDNLTTYDKKRESELLWDDEELDRKNDPVNIVAARQVCGDLEREDSEAMAGVNVQEISMKFQRRLCKRQKNPVPVSTSNWQAQEPETSRDTERAGECNQVRAEEAAPPALEIVKKSKTDFNYGATVNVQLQEKFLQRNADQLKENAAETCEFGKKGDATSFVNVQEVKKKFQRQFSERNDQPVMASSSRERKSEQEIIQIGGIYQANSSSPINEDMTTEDREGRRDECAAEKSIVQEVRLKCEMKSITIKHNSIKATSKDEYIRESQRLQRSLEDTRALKNGDDENDDMAACGYDAERVEKGAIGEVNFKEIQRKIQRSLSAKNDTSQLRARKRQRVEGSSKRSKSSESISKLGYSIFHWDSDQQTKRNDTSLQNRCTWDEYIKKGSTWVQKRFSYDISDNEDFESLSREDRLLKLASYEEMLRHKELSRGSQPHVVVTKGVTKEQKVVISTAEALTRLDMAGAAKDPRRFNYICKLLEFCIINKLCSFSGTAQKILFNSLEEVLKHVMATNNNIHVMKNLLKEARHALKRSQYDHVGSSSLWAKHMETINRMQNTLNSYEIEQREEDGKIKISDLPDECIHQILFRLTDHRDLVNAGLTESRTYDLSEHDSLWRQLCLFHFTNKQWHAVLRKEESVESLGWKTLYSRLVRRYGTREVYTEMLHLCRHCNALFWNLHGHPCLVPDMKPEAIPIGPEMCVSLFNA